jgi:hypothetical protein
MTAKALWYADGLRWIGSLFHSAAEHLERPSLSANAGEPHAFRPTVDEYLSDVRFRLQDRF